MIHTEPDMLGAFSPERAPVLTGYGCDPEEAFLARDRGALLSLFIDMGGPFHTRTEPSSEGGSASRFILSYREIAGAIGQARDLGLQSAVFENITTPDFHPQLRGIISHVHSLNIIPVVSADIMAITGEFAEFLQDRNASVLVRLQSPDHPERANMERLLRRELRKLIEAGFADTGDRHGPRLGAVWTDGRFPPEEIETFWHFCRHRNIAPVVQRRSGPHPRTPDGEERDADLMARLREIDHSRYGYRWSPETFPTPSECFRLLYSLTVTGEGNIRPCAGMAFDKDPTFLREGVYPHNIRIRSLGEIYEDPIFRYVRTVEQHLGTVPGNDTRPDACIGCRDSL